MAKAFAVGVSAGLMMGGRRDIYTPAIVSINSKNNLIYEPLAVMSAVFSMPKNPNGSLALGCRYFYI